MEILATALVTALATKAFEKIGEKTGENVQETVVGFIKNLFQPNELISLNLSAEHLIQPIEQGKLIGKLEDRLISNPDIAQRLQELIDSFKEKTVIEKTTNTKIVKGNFNEKTKDRIIQNAKGRNIQQFGQVNGNVINTNRFQNKTEVLYDPNLYITDAEARQIREKVNEIVDINEKAGKFITTESKKKFYGNIWTGLYKRFEITKYTLLPKYKFEECMSWLQSEIGKNTKKLRRGNNSEWRSKRCGAIYARARSNWDMSKEQVYEFAFQRLKLKQPINSLNELNDAKLNRLYQILFSK